VLRAGEAKPDVAVVDAALLNADVVRALLEQSPGTRIIAFGVADDWDDVQACAATGVAGFVTRNSSVADLVQAVHSARRGELICSPRIAALMFERMRTGENRSEPQVQERALTTREREICELLERGLSNKEIARRLFIEQATVKNHVHNILEKLQVTRRGEAAATLRRAVRSRQPVDARSGSF
jgi:two-component system nitrate/nitrite response regulator NarL